MRGCDRWGCGGAAKRQGTLADDAGAVGAEPCVWQCFLLAAAGARALGALDPRGDCVAQGALIIAAVARVRRAQLLAKRPAGVERMELVHMLLHEPSPALWSRVYGLFSQWPSVDYRVQYRQHHEFQ